VRTRSAKASSSPEAPIPRPVAVSSTFGIVPIVPRTPAGYTSQVYGTTLHRIAVSLPFTGPIAHAGREVLRGAELALEQRSEPDVELVRLDSFGADRDHAAVRNARESVADPDVLAYLGDFHSSQVMATAPILGAADLLAVAPVATYVGLRGQTLVRLMPHDGVGARAIAAWLVDSGVGDVLVVHAHDPDYGTPVAAMCIEAARSCELAVRSRRVWDHAERPADDLGDAEAVVYVGVAGSATPRLWQELHEVRPALWLLGSEGIAQAGFARALAPAAAARTRLFVAPRGPLAFYGYEAMSLILDAVDAGAGDRRATARAARATRDRRSLLGSYSLDDEGHTTSPAYGRMAVVAGTLAWDT
jgi:branched-chain amino acid transport system substrate-binding protein